MSAICEDIRCTVVEIPQKLCVSRRVGLDKESVLNIMHDSYMKRPFRKSLIPMYHYEEQFEESIYIGSALNWSNLDSGIPRVLDLWSTEENDFVQLGDMMKQQSLGGKPLVLTAIAKVAVSVEPFMHRLNIKTITERILLRLYGRKELEGYQSSHEDTRFREKYFYPERRRVF